jgi:hypothetical protein
MSWLKHFFWFIVTSKDFLSCSYLRIIRDGGISKGINHANFMVKWDKMTTEEKELWYINEDRNIEL